MPYCHEDVTIYPQVILPTHYHIEQGVYIPPGVELGEHIFLGPRCYFTNDPFPRCGVPCPHYHTWVEDGVSIGAGAGIRVGVRIGRCSLIGIGSVVTKDVPPGEVWGGNPACKIRDVRPEEWHPYVSR